MALNSEVGSTLADLRILYYGAGWPTNIGNAFLDLGAMELLREAAPEARIGFASEMPRFFLQRRRRWKERYGLEKTPADRGMDRALDMAAVSECDVVAFAGMAMCADFIDINGPSILALARRNVAVLLLGTGGRDYDDQERQVYRRFLTQLNVLAFVARDSRSFDLFGPDCATSYNGIDCAFFLPEAYQPFETSFDPYVVAAFDTSTQPPLDLRGRRLVHAHHRLINPTPVEDSWPADTLLSDIPHDYLTLYANAEEVHSDRVHACVAALAYGRHARLYHGTPRGSLFEAVGAPRIRDEVVRLDMASLRERKADQVRFVRHALDGLTASRRLHDKAVPSR